MKERGLGGTPNQEFNDRRQERQKTPEEDGTILY
jgi:hypothetical protein